MFKANFSVHNTNLGTQKLFVGHCPVCLLWLRAWTKEWSSKWSTWFRFRINHIGSCNKRRTKGNALDAKSHKYFHSKI